MKKINPKNLFSKEILNFSVKTKNGVLRYINFDNAATTPAFFDVEKQVAQYMISYGSVHRGSGEKSKISTDLYEATRDVIKKFVNAEKDSYVIFSQNTTGAVNACAYFFSFLKGKVAVSEIEHSSSYLPWIKEEGGKKIGSKQIKFSDLEKINEKIQFYGNKQIIVYKTDKNLHFDLKNIEKILRQNKIKVFVLTASSNVNGYCPDIKKIGQIVHKYGAYFFVDACQYLQHHKIDMKKMNIDFLVASGHKFYAPHGGGFLIAPKKFCDKFLPYQIGGGNLPYITKSGYFLRYENQLAHDPGTPNAVGCVAMAKAIEVLQDIGIKKIENYEKEIANKIYQGLLKNKRIKIYVDSKNLNTVIPFNIIGLDADFVADKLNDDFGIGVRAGNFCVYQFIRKIMNIKDEKEIIESVKNGNKDKIPSLLRVSVGLCNTKKDADRFLYAINKIIQIYGQKIQ
ncbi:MAG: aminotransferase class V-fold PLP-dependent enzyme [Patescibacteria group bacterium]|nr:aminotransferase class V-fold PLP-dependent enzyme [Patescibacteria group bacterium]